MLLVSPFLTWLLFRLLHGALICIESDAHRLKKRGISHKSSGHRESHTTHVSVVVTVLFSPTVGVMQMI